MKVVLSPVLLTVVLGCVPDSWTLRPASADASIDAPPRPALRPLAAVQPPTATLLSAARPKLTWIDDQGCTATLRICRTRDCPAGDAAREETGPFVRGVRFCAWTAPTPMAPGRYWWSLARGAMATTPRWFEVPSARAPGSITAGDRALPDLDGDGQTELLVGAPLPAATVGAARGAFVIVDPRTGTRAVTFAPDGAGPRFAEAVAVAGDTDDDGRQEVMVTDLPSRVYVLFADASGRYTRHVTLTATQPDEVLGAAAAGVGDLDGDGYGDIAVSSQTATHTRVLIFHGAATGTPARPTGALLGAGSSREPTMALASAGDRDGDGYTDLAVGLPGYTDPGDPTNAGRGFVMVFAGSPSGVFGAIKSTRVGLASAGRRLYPAGDIDGDGVADLLLGGLAAGSSLVLRGPATRGVGGWASAQPNPLPCVLPAGALMSLEAATTPLGDINGDGLDDVASLIAGHCGAVFFGRASPPGSSPTTLPETELPRFEMPVGVALPPMGEVAFGAAVAGPGDVNGDGLPDLAVTSPRSPQPGRVHVYFGRLGRGPGPAPDVTFDDATPGFGAALAR